MNIAIIGAGIGGTTAATFLREAFGHEVKITVYEQAVQVGGRVAHIDFAGVQIETGATLIHSSNQHLSQLMAQLGLDPVAPHDGNPENRTVGIWNGRSFLLQTSPSSLRTNLTMLWRYRRSLLRLQRLVQEFIRPWEKIYERQANGEAWQSPAELLQALDIFHLTQISSYDYFSQQGISERLITEFVDGASRVNYGQDGQINAFANAVSLTGAGLAGGDLFSVRGGNRLLCERGLANAGVDLRLETAVSAITSNPNGHYQVVTNATNTAHDIVIIATPLERTNITLSDIPLAPNAEHRRGYQVTHATFVLGELNPAAFGLSVAAQPPKTILTTESPDIPFSSIGLTAVSPTGPIYKLFSRQPLPDQTIATLFHNPRDTKRVTWHAYTKLKPTTTYPPFVLAPNLYYVNAMETAVSTMETESVASRNIVNLIQQAQNRAFR
ncbi:MAG: FAD-dependent oxidoreductase [Chloroflexota bacterium]